MGLTDDELVVLALIHQLKHPTAGDVRRHLPVARPMYDLYRKLKKLEQLELVDKTPLYPEQGARSPRYYHVRLAGARALGLDGVGSDHYRRPSPTVHHAGQVRRELMLIAGQRCWRLLAEETEAKQCLASVLVEAARATYGEAFPGYSLLPADLKIHPDLVLDTGQRVVLVIIGHPHASAIFWRKRVERYQGVLGVVAAVCFVLSEQQRQDAEQAVQTSLYAKRFLVLQADQVEELVRRLAPSP